MTKTVYELLNMSKEEFTNLLLVVLLNITDIDYADEIAKSISDDVAQDICDSADTEHWSIEDLKLGIGRVIMKSLGIQ